MRGPIVVFLIAALSASAPAQWDARSIGRAGMSGIAEREYWVGHRNPSVLGNVQFPFLSISVLPAPYGLPELRRIGALFGSKLFGHGVCAEVKAYGAELFRRYDLSTGIAVPLERRTFVGVGMSLRRWSFRSYSSTTDWNITGGFVRYESGWSLGASAQLRPAPDVERQTAVDVFAGVTIRPVDALDISWEVEQLDDAEMLFRCGCSYWLTESVAVYAGWSDIVPLVSFGATVSMGPYQCSFGSQHHDVLGWTHAIGLSFQLSGSGSSREGDGR